MISIDNIISISNILVDSEIKADFLVKTAIINNVSNIEIVLKEFGKLLIITGDESPDQDGEIKKRTLTIEENEKHRVFIFMCSYTGDYLTSNLSGIYSFKITKGSIIKKIHNRY
jgi:hypothetical protein